MSLNAQEVCLQAHIRKRSEYPHHRPSVAWDSSFTFPLIQQVPQLSLLMQALHSPLHSLLCISTTTVSHNHATTWSAYVGKNLGDCWCLQRLMKTLQNKWITRDKKKAVEISLEQGTCWVLEDHPLLQLETKGSTQGAILTELKIGNQWPASSYDEDNLVGLQLKQARDVCPRHLRWEYCSPCTTKTMSCLNVMEAAIRLLRSAHAIWQFLGIRSPWHTFWFLAQLSPGKNWRQLC